LEDHGKIWQHGWHVGPVVEVTTITFSWRPRSVGQDPRGTGQGTFLFPRDREGRIRGVDIESSVGQTTGRRGRKSGTEMRGAWE